MTLAEFLLARYAEDEARHGAWHTVDCGTDQGYWALDRCNCDIPVRVLADIASKRAIIESHRLLDAHVRQVALSDPEEARDARNSRAGVEVAMGFLALPYAEHPDYRKEWKP